MYLNIKLSQYHKYSKQLSYPMFSDYQSFNLIAAKTNYIFLSHSLAVKQHAICKVTSYFRYQIRWWSKKEQEIKLLY